MYKSFNFSMPLTMLIIVFLNFSCPRIWEVVSHFDFHLHFPKYWWAWTSFYVFSGRFLYSLEKCLSKPQMIFVYIKIWEYLS